jgi:hypothetical protein
MWLAQSGPVDQGVILVEVCIASIYGFVSPSVVGLFVCTSMYVCMAYCTATPHSNPQTKLVSVQRCSSMSKKRKAHALFLTTGSTAVTLHPDATGQSYFETTVRFGVLRRSIAMGCMDGSLGASLVCSPKA